MSGGSSNPLATTLLNMIQNQPGGLQGLVQTFHDKGLGGLVSSWVSTGPNPAISSIRSIRFWASDQIKALAAKAGINPDIAGALRLHNCCPRWWTSLRRTVPFQITVMFWKWRPACSKTSRQKLHEFRWRMLVLNMRHTFLSLASSRESGLVLPHIVLLFWTMAFGPLPWPLMWRIITLPPPRLWFRHRVNLPNSITLTRIAAIPLLIWILCTPRFAGERTENGKSWLQPFLFSLRSPTALTAISLANAGRSHPWECCWIAGGQIADCRSVYHTGAV